MTGREGSASLPIALLKWWMLVCKSGHMSLTVKRLIRRGPCRGRYVDICIACVEI